MKLDRAILALVLFAAMPAGFLSQQPEPLVAFGGLRVPACSVSSDPEYGLTQQKPIQLGGSPVYAAARMARYIGAIRGPAGQAVQLGVRGSTMAPAGYWDEPTFIDGYQVLYEGKSTTLWVDTYHFSLPRVPMGFTCGGPLVTTLGLPPLDPLKTTPAIVATAIEHGTANEVVPVSLDPANPRGYLLDQSMMIALRARAAAKSGMPWDSNKPPAGVDAVLLNVVAYPITCAGRTITPQSVDIGTPQQPLQRTALTAGAETLKATFPGMSIPEGSVAASFRPGQLSQVKITYAEGCDGASAEVLLPVQVTPPRIMAIPGTLPAGISEADPTVYLQVILDAQGKFVHPIHIGGPKSLLQAAISTIGTWQAEPPRLNGAPLANPMLLQVIFR